MNDKFLLLFESHFKRNYIHVKDIAYTFQFIIEHYSICNNNVFNVGMSEINMSKMELALKIKEHIPELLILENEFKKDFDQRNYIVSNEKLERLGWKPTFDLDYGIKQLIDAYQIIINYKNKQFTNL